MVEVITILAISGVAQSAHFTWRQGRATVYADSVQYVDGAEALLSTDRVAHFEFRKPGYALVLVAAQFLFGSMGWGACVLNHICLSLLPVVAYGLGFHLRSRLVGWMAALLTVAQLQALTWGDTILSEPSYMLLLGLGVLAFAVALSRQCPPHLMAGAGLCLACAWLIRSIAIVPVLVALVAVAWTMRYKWRRAIAAGCLLLVPFLSVFLFECGMNAMSSGRFRPCTGTLGVMMMWRARSVQGLPFADSASARKCLALLPERDADDAYRLKGIDAWVARHRAINQLGMDEWEVDALFKQTAIEMFAEAPAESVRLGAGMALRLLLRQRVLADYASGPPYTSAPPEVANSVIMHPAGVDDPQFGERWAAYWALPYRSLSRSLDIFNSMQARAKERAPFGRGGPWDELRYYSRVGPVMDVLNMTRSVASLWPGFALMLCAGLCLNRRTCAFLAAVYVLEAGVIAVCGTDDSSNWRYGTAWLAMDATLAAALVGPVVAIPSDSLSRWFRRSRLGRYLARPRAGHVVSTALPAPAV